MVLGDGQFFAYVITDQWASIVWDVMGRVI